MARILTVDDNEIDRLAIAKVLKAWGHEVLEADDGVSAMRVLNEKSGRYRI